jgi:hypothetical protein
VSDRELRWRAYIEKPRPLVIEKVPRVHDDDGATPKKEAEHREKKQGG